MKKLVTLLLVFTLIGTSLFSLTGCSKEKEEDLSAKIEEKAVAYQTDLYDSAGTLTTVDAVKEYLTSWAKSKGISCTTDGYGNVIMSVKASNAYQDADPAVVLCSYDPKNFENCIEPMASAMYLIKNNEKTGKLTVIFTKEVNHDFSGIQKLNSKYFTDDTNVFCLSKGGNNMWSVNTGARSTYAFSSNLHYTAPTKDKAYRITIDGLSGGIPDAKVNAYPNPIKEIGDLLAYFKTNSFIFELGRIKGGEHANTYPKSASVTIVIDQDDDEKFQSRMETAIENFQDHFLENNPDVTYTYEDVDLPQRVVTQESQNDLIKILYPLVNGAYYDEETDELISISSIGSIRLTDSSYTIRAVGNSLSEERMEEITRDYKTICGLADIKFQKTSSQPGWHTDPESEFVQEALQAFSDYCGKETELKDYVPAANTSYIYEKNENCDIIHIALNEERLERYTGAILTFLMNQTHTEETE